MSADVRNAAAAQLWLLRKQRRFLLTEAQDEFIPARAALTMRAKAEAIEWAIEAVRAVVHDVELAELEAALNELKAEGLLL